MATEGQAGFQRLPFDIVSRDGATGGAIRAVAIEQPVAIEVNGLGYAVMMATPADLTDFAYGFALAERLIDRPAQLIDIIEHPTERGTILRITLAPACADRVIERVRHRVSESSCGLCGIENLEQALRPLRPVSTRSAASPAAVFAALEAIRDWQPLNGATGAAHAAAACSANGEIRIAREDVGRHNAFDKLVGAMARQGVGWDGGFALLTARCSYELVEKAILADCPMLVTISAPTALAMDTADRAGLRLMTLARPDSYMQSRTAGGTPWRV
jgi:FdhD protein